MNKFKVLGIALMASAAVGYAQDVDQAKKAIDAEQYEKAKSMLKAVVKAKPTNGKAAFLLGNIYLTQNVADSAKIYFQKGLAATEDAKFNYIGLGQMDLDNGNITAAQSNFALATKDAKKKDTEAYIYVAKAYMNAAKPNYKSAIEVLNKAKLANPQDAQVQIALGDAFYGDKNQNEAYAAYRTASQIDASLIRPKMQQGVLLKGAKAYTEAVKNLDGVQAANQNYGPIYRELAETYYYWGANEPRNQKEYFQKALGYYEKYMSLTDYSLASRMRHADFLILAKDYKALEAEANKVNPRILRYLGYSAYENGNTDAAVQAMQGFISNPANKIIARDYLYLGLAKMRKANNLETKVLDPVAFQEGVANVKKAVEMEITMTNDLSEVGKKLFAQKMYNEAASIFGIAITNPDSRNYTEDILYYSICVYTVNKGIEEGKGDLVSLDKADKGLDLVISKYPDYQDAYYHKARINRLLAKDNVMTKSYDDYLRVVTAKGPEEVTKNKVKFIEAYNNMAAAFADTDKVKAKEYFGKTLALDPTNDYATKSLSILK